MKGFSRYAGRVLALLMLLTLVSIDAVKARAQSWGGYVAVPTNSTYFNTDQPVACTVYDNRLFVVIRSKLTDASSNNIYYWNFFDGLSWGGWGQVPNNIRTNGSPSIASYNGNLYLFVAAQDGRILANRFNPAVGGWQGWFAPPGNLRSSYGPSATAFNGSLFVYAKGESTNAIFQKSLTGSTWSGETQVPGTARTVISPSSANLYGTTLGLFHMGQSNNDLYYQLTPDGVAYGADTLVPNGAQSNRTPNAVSFGSVYLFHRGNNSGKVFYQTSPSASPLSFSAVAEVPGGFYTNLSPNATVYQSKLFLFTVDSNGQVYYNTLF